MIMNFSDFMINDIQGNNFDLSSLLGKKILLVNTASACGLTPQFEQLQELYATFKDQNFTVIGFPSNDFAGQDPGSNAEIAAFCQRNYGVDFPMMEKVQVVGEEAHPIFKWLTAQAENEPKWNFHKYLIDEKGAFVKDISPQTLPIDESIISWITE
jgi:glutathione peroxidase